jgi:hypothetical protein
VYIKLVVLLRNYVTMMHGQQNIKNGWATIVVVGRLRVKDDFDLEVEVLVGSSENPVHMYQATLQHIVGRLAQSV